MKKISLLILMLTFLLIPTCVNANAISWEDFTAEIKKASGLDFDSVLDNNQNLKLQFMNDYNNCVGFCVLGDFGFTSISPDNVDNKYLFICFTPNNGYRYISFNALRGSDTYWRVNTSNVTNYYKLDIESGSLSRVPYTDSNKNLFNYNLNQQIDWSEQKFLSKTGLDFFLTTSYVLSWNFDCQANYYDYSNGTYTNNNITINLDSIPDSDYPWEDGNAGGSGSGDTYYNYDFNEYFQKPWISIDNVQGLVQSTSTIPFKVMSQSGDEYYPFDKLKLDLRVYKIYTDENGKKTQSLFDTYKRYNGDYVDTTGYNSVTQNGKINVYNYDLRDKFDSNFIDTYLNSNSGDVGSGNVFDYAFQLVLYSFWEDELSSTKLFYFYERNNLNSGTIPDNYYDNNWNTGSGFDFENINFDSVLNTAKNFLSSIFGFFSLFPDWLIYLLTFGISVGVILRILGR